jgi:DNA-binding CsgD family transcriptional regulator
MVVTNISSADLRSALVAAGEWQRATTLHELACVATATLHELIDCEGVGWNEVDLQGQDVRAITSPIEYFDPAHVENLNRLIAEHPVVRYVAHTGDTSATKISDFVSAREFHALEIYADFFRPLGAEDLLAVLVQAAPVMIGIAFTRPRRSYTERDRELLNLVRPHLATAYANVAAREALERGLEGRRVVRLTTKGALAEPCPLLDEWFGGTPRRLEPGVYARDGAELVVRRVDDVLILEERRFRPDPERVRTLGLSAREAEVLSLAGRGLTDGQIARELYLSARTVAKHLEHAYAKLGTHTRSDAVAQLLGRYPLRDPTISV